MTLGGKRGTSSVALPKGFPCLFAVKGFLGGLKGQRVLYAVPVVWGKLWFVIAGYIIKLTWQETTHNVAAFSDTKRLSFLRKLSEAKFRCLIASWLETSQICTVWQQIHKYLMLYHQATDRLHSQGYETHQFIINTQFSKINIAGLKWLKYCLSL